MTDQSAEIINRLSRIERILESLAWVDLSYSEGTGRVDAAGIPLLHIVQRATCRVCGARRGDWHNNDSWHKVDCVFYAPND